jgi:hypothetical protein
MKSKLLINLLMAATFIAMTAFTITTGTQEMTKLTVKENTESNNWGPWKQTDCYRGLDFRVKKRGPNYDNTKYIWAVQFRNRYDDKIHFNYEVYDSRPSSPRTTNRTDLSPNETSSGYRDFYMHNGNSIYVYVDRVRLGKDGLQDYYNCDK